MFYKFLASGLVILYINSLPTAQEMRDKFDKRVKFLQNESNFFTQTDALIPFRMVNKKHYDSKISNDVINLIGSFIVQKSDAKTEIEQKTHMYNQILKLDDSLISDPEPLASCVFREESLCPNIKFTTLLTSEQIKSVSELFIECYLNGMPASLESLNLFTNLKTLHMFYMDLESFLSLTNLTTITKLILHGTYIGEVAKENKLGFVLENDECFKSYPKRISKDVKHMLAPPSRRL